MTNNQPYAVYSKLLDNKLGIRHAFFGRRGGISRGTYLSLNCSYNSDDNTNNVKENRQRALRALGFPKGKLLTLDQIHSSRAVKVQDFWSSRNAPLADAMATKKTGVILGILAADCVPLLLFDDKACIIGAAHLGWRGAQAGLVKSALATMQQLGADLSYIKAVIGPAIAQHSYEVGPEFHESFLADNKFNDKHFIAIPNKQKFLFDLTGYIEANLNDMGINQIDKINVDTFTSTDLFFSSRQAKHAGEKDFGRNLSVITIS